MDEDELTMSPYGAFLGIEIVEYSEGQSSCRLALKDHHMNSGGRIHGGVLTSLADTAAGVALRTVRPEGKLSVTTDLSISFIRPPQGGSLEAKASILHAGRRLVRCEIDVYSDYQLVAKSSATFMIIESSRI